MARSQRPAIKDVFLRIGIALFLVGATYWMLLVNITAIYPENPLVPILAPIVGLEKNVVAKPKVPTEIKTLDDFMYSDTLYKFYGLCTIIILTGLFTVTRGRNVVEKYVLLQAYALPRQRDHWGKVRDLATRKPVPFATVRINKIEHGKEVFISQTVADLDGRYRLYLPEDDAHYLLEVKANEYVDYREPIKKLVLEGDNVIRTNVMMEAEKYSGQLRKSLYRRYQERFLGTLTFFILFISITTFLHATYSLIFHFNTISVGDMIFYGFAAPWNFFVLWERRKFKPGRFLNTLTKQPVAFVKVQVILSEEKQLSVLSDKSGIIKFDLDEGTYDFKVIHPGFTVLDSNQGALRAEINADGYLKRNIYLKPLGGFAQDSTMLRNPFGS